MDLTDIFKILLALILSGLIGLEREQHGRAAGFRTHILVGVGSALMMIISINMHKLYGASADPSRIAAQVISGIGFLGAGTIIRFKASIRGLTTAASLWAVAGIGLAVGSGGYILAIVTTAIILGVLFFLPDFERNILRSSAFKTLQIEGSKDLKILQEVRLILAEYRSEIKDFSIKTLSDQEDSCLIEFNLKILGRYTENIKNDLVRIAGIKSINWI
ncbi:MAG: MgtC/SapB family protein [Candidatus Kaelpia aquatica]|nr:MgtC/SapB family protein [Candidatus Kaelpia aquatica]